jgi:predicted transposase YbfD/YdcC
MSLLALTPFLTLIDDPRQDKKVIYPLFDILFLTIVAVIGGSEGWEDIEDFGHCHITLLKKYGDFSQGIPVHDTIARVISRVDPDALQHAFIQWMQQTEQLSDGRIIAVDGKTLRSSYNRAGRQSAIHMVNAFCVTNGVVLGQAKTEEKSNEITAIPALLALLDIEGSLVTIDAMGTQKAIAETIVDKGADYLLAVKGNQKTLYDALNQAFAEKRADNNIAPDGIECQRGRTEYRDYQVLDARTLSLPYWPELKSIGMAVSYRNIKGEEKLNYRYYISSAVLSTERFAQAVRGHWCIENQLHWVLDVTMGEDRSPIHRGAENLARLRQCTVNLLKKEPSTLSIRRKRRRAAMDSTYLEKIINA